MIIRGNSREGCTDLLFMPKLECSLLGRDLQVQLGVGVVPKGGQMVTEMMVTKLEDEKAINRKVWAEGGARGLLNIPPDKNRNGTGNPTNQGKTIPHLHRRKKRTNSSNKRIDQKLNTGTMHVPAQHPNTTYKEIRCNNIHITSDVIKYLQISTRSPRSKQTYNFSEPSSIKPLHPAKQRTSEACMVQCS